jgi:hypothetical protein
MTHFIKIKDRFNMVHETILIPYKEFVKRKFMIIY